MIVAMMMISGVMMAGSTTWMLERAREHENKAHTMYKILLRGGLHGGYKTTTPAKDGEAERVEKALGEIQIYFETIAMRDALSRDVVEDLELRDAFVRQLCHHKRTAEALLRQHAEIEAHDNGLQLR